MHRAWHNFRRASGRKAFATADICDCSWGACGLRIGFAIWPPRDPIAGPWVPYIVIGMTIGTALVSLIFGGLARLVSLPGKQRVFVWIAFFSVVAFGPVALAVTRPLVRRRIRNNERIAAERFAGLNSAVKRTAGDYGDSNRICDGSVLRQHYAGPGFSDEDWRRITGNYVKQNGYVLWCTVAKKAGTQAWQNRPEWQSTGDGGFARMNLAASPVEWDGSRNACMPCGK